MLYALPIQEEILKISKKNDKIGGKSNEISNKGAENRLDFSIENHRHSMIAILHNKK